VKKIKAVSILIFILGILLIPSFAFASIQTVSFTGHQIVNITEKTNNSSSYSFKSTIIPTSGHQQVTKWDNSTPIDFDFTWTTGYSNYAPWGNGSGSSAYKSHIYTLTSGDLWLSYDDANYTVSSQTVQTVSVSSPVNNQTYTTKPNISFSAEGFDGQTIGASLNNGQALYSWDIIPNVTTYPITVSGSDIPLKTGSNTLVFTHGSTTLATITFTYNPSTPMNYYINGVTDGQTYQNSPTVSVGKDSNTPELQFIFNGAVVWDMAGGVTKSLSWSPSALNWVNGYNTLQLKKVSDGTLLVNVKVTVMDITPPVTTTTPTPAWDEGFGTPPTPPASGIDLIGWIKFIFDYIIYLITYLVTGVGTIFSSLIAVITSLLSSIGNIGTLMQQLFSFMPPQLVNTLVLGVMCTVIISVIRAIRGNKN
jgi:hypothetical protein